MFLFRGAQKKESRHDAGFLLYLRSANCLLKTTYLIRLHTDVYLPVSLPFFDF